MTTLRSVVERKLKRAWAIVLEKAPPALRARQRRLKWERDFDRAAFPMRCIAIETLGNCNRSCSYCPVSVFPLRKGRMSNKLFEKIILELADIGYVGDVHFHFYNEPLLDKRIAFFCNFARQRLPHNFMLLQTNGDLLTVDRARELLATGISNLGISCHDRDASEHAKAVIAEMSEEEKARMSYSNVWDTDNFAYTSRAGTISGDYTYRAVAGDWGCDKIEYHIDYLGNVHPCGEDMEGGYVLGNINNDSLVGIWDKNRGNFRDHFLANFTRDVCRRCAGVDCAKSKTA